eukprot:85879-Chlamydomonas_euryale.AAC.1
MGTWASGWGARRRLPGGKFTSLRTASSFQTDRVFSDGRVVFQTVHSPGVVLFRRDRTTPCFRRVCAVFQAVPCSGKSVG